MGNEVQVPVASKVGIKETMEALACAEAFVDAAKAMLADGKLTLLDLIQLQSVIEPVRVAMEGSAMIKDEFKDLDKEEAALIFGAMWDVILKVFKVMEVKVPVPG